MRKDQIIEMFCSVDAGQWDALSQYYHPQCRYERPGFPAISGLDDLHDFYASVRPIASGAHRIDSMVEEGDLVCALGSFDGQLKTGDPISLRFADRYRFESDRIIERTTYFYAPLA